MAGEGQGWFLFYFERHKCSFLPSCGSRVGGMCPYLQSNHDSTTLSFSLCACAHACSGMSAHGMFGGVCTHMFRHVHTWRVQECPHMHVQVCLHTWHVQVCLHTCSDTSAHTCSGTSAQTCSGMSAHAYLGVSTHASCISSSLIF